MAQDQVPALQAVRQTEPASLSPQDRSDARLSAWEQAGLGRLQGGKRSFNVFLWVCFCEIIFSLTVKRHKPATDLSTHISSETAVAALLKVMQIHEGPWKEEEPQCKGPHLTSLSCHLSAPSHPPDGPLSINPWHVCSLLSTNACCICQPVTTEP